MVQLHKHFSDEQIKEFIQKYLGKEVERKPLQEVLGINKTRFFALVKAYRADCSSFSIDYSREKATRSISRDVEENIWFTFNL